MSTQQNGPGLQVAIEGAVATVEIRNPARRNAMTPDMWRALPPLLDRIEADPAVRVLVLTGANGSFCAGADIGDLDELLDAGDASVAVTAEERLAAFAKPTVAAIEGPCIGGGCQLAVACDLRIASAGARFGVPPAKLGLVYPTPTTRRLVQLIGPAATKFLIFTGELIGAERAAAMGLVDEVVAVDGFAERVAALTATIASRSQLSAVATKDVVRMVAAGEVDPARLAQWHGLVRVSGDAAEGVAAFGERRTPDFGWVLPADRPTTAD